MGYNISTIDINNDGRDELILEDISASWWRNTFILTLDQEPVPAWDSYKPKLVLFCKTCRFNYNNGYVEFNDLDGNGSIEAIVQGGIENADDRREEIYYFEDGIYVKKSSKIIEPQISNP